MQRQAHAARIVVERRPAERWSSPVVVGSVCCSTCCCCCCCAHTLGSVVGAAGASVAASVDTSGRVAAAVYWGIVVVLAVPSAALALVGDELALGIILYAIFFPVLQLAASALAVPVLALFPVENRRRALGALGAITAAGFVGGLVLGAIGVVIGLIVLGAGV